MAVEEEHRRRNDRNFKVLFVDLNATDLNDINVC